MSGRRCRALRREFIKRHGRAPGAVETKYGKVSEWRRVKREYKHGTR